MQSGFLRFTPFYFYITHTLTIFHSPLTKLMIRKPPARPSAVLRGGRDLWSTVENTANTRDGDRDSVCRASAVSISKHKFIPTSAKPYHFTPVENGTACAAREYRRVGKAASMRAACPYKYLIVLLS